MLVAALIAQSSSSSDDGGIMSWIIGFIIIALMVMWVANRFVKAGQSVKGRDRCAYCRARLKFAGVGKSGQMGQKAGYASVCAKCGREQPWAT